MRLPLDIRQKIIEEVRAGNLRNAVARDHGLTKGTITKIMQQSDEREKFVVPKFASVREPREWIQAMARKLGMAQRDLLVLTEDCDPFNAGGKTQRKLGEWFAKLWDKEFKGKVGIHVRRVHYRADATGFLKLDGNAYTNCDPDWLMLTKASKFARNLGLVDPRGFVDNRNDAPRKLNWLWSEATQPVVVPPIFYASLPSVRISNLEMDWDIRDVTVTGYDRSDYIDRAFYCELWIEKSTMNDILEPICDELGIQLITSIGTQSITNAIALMDRSIKIGKPTRVFYVSDFDRKGTEMPVSVSRHIEFWKKTLGLSLDIKLFPTCLTRAQIIEHKLPKNKETKATELDALEGRVPGEFAKIIREAAAPYVDDTLDDQMRETKEEAVRNADEEWNEIMDPNRRQLRKLQKEVERVARKYQKEVVSLNRRLGKAMKQFERPLAELTGKIEQDIENYSPDIPDRPSQDAEIDVDESAALLDTDREYYPAQLDAFKKYQAAIDAVLPRLKPKRKTF